MDIFCVWMFQRGSQEQGIRCFDRHGTFEGAIGGVAMARSRYVRLWAADHDIGGGLTTPHPPPSYKGLRSYMKDRSFAIRIVFRAGLPPSLALTMATRNSNWAGDSELLAITTYRRGRPDVARRSWKSPDLLRQDDVSARIKRLRR